MSLYPSLEDMKVDKIYQAQSQIADQFAQNQGMPPSAPSNSLPYELSPVPTNNAVVTMYPGLGEYMGIEFTSEIIAANMPEYLHPAHPQQNTVAIAPTVGHSSLVAPLSGASLGLQRAEVSHAIREVTLCKDHDHKVGVRVKNVDKGIFVCFVKKNSPAALAKLRFGDQILQVNGKTVAGYSVDKVHDLFKKSSENGIVLAIRDRPFERTITMHKDSTGHIGFQFSSGEIVSLVKDSSAARNGVLINHQLLEVNGQNVVGLKDKEITTIIVEGGQIVTITVMPSFVYKVVMKNIASSLVSKLMDHSVSDL